MSYYSVAGDSTILSDGTVTTAGFRTTQDVDNGICCGWCCCFDCLWACCLKDDYDSDKEFKKIVKRDKKNALQQKGVMATIRDEGQHRRKADLDDGGDGSSFNEDSTQGSARDGSIILRLQSREEVNDFLEFQKWKQKKEDSQPRSKLSSKSRKSPLRLRIGDASSSHHSQTSLKSRRSNPRSRSDEDSHSTEGYRGSSRRSFHSHYEDDSIDSFASSRSSDNRLRRRAKWFGRKSRRNSSRGPHRRERNNGEHERQQESEEQRNARRRQKPSKNKEEKHRNRLPPNPAKGVPAKGVPARTQTTENINRTKSSTTAKVTNRDLEKKLHKTGGNKKHHQSGSSHIGNSGPHQVGVKGILVKGSKDNLSQQRNQENFAESVPSSEQAVSSSEPPQPQVTKAVDIHGATMLKESIGTMLSGPESPSEPEPQGNFLDEQISPERVQRQDPAIDSLLTRPRSTHVQAKDSDETSELDQNNDSSIDRAWARDDAKSYIRKSGTPHEAGTGSTLARDDENSQFCESAPAREADSPIVDRYAVPLSPASTFASASKSSKSAKIHKRNSEDTPHADESSSTVASSSRSEEVQELNTKTSYDKTRSPTPRLPSKTGAIFHRLQVETRSIKSGISTWSATLSSSGFSRSSQVPDSIILSTENEIETSYETRRNEETEAVEDVAEDVEDVAEEVEDVAEEVEDVAEDVNLSCISSKSSKSSSEHKGKKKMDLLINRVPASVDRRAVWNSRKFRQFNQVHTSPVSV